MPVSLCVRKHAYAVNTNGKHHLNLKIRLLGLLLTCILASFVIVYASLTEKAFLIGTSFVLLGTLISVLAGLNLHSSASDRDCLYIALTVYFATVIVTVWVYYSLISQYGYPYLGGGSDDLTYETDAILSADLGGISSYRGFADLLGHTYSGYYYVIGVIYIFAKMFGDYHTLLPRLFNAAVLSLVSILTYKIGKIVGISKAASLRAGYWVGLYPLLSFFAANVVRDTIIVLLVLVMVYLYLKVIQSGIHTKSLIYITLGMITLVCIWSLRDFSAIACIGSIAASMALSRRDARNRASRWPQLLLLFLIVIGTIVFGALVLERVLDLSGRLNEFSYERLSMTSSGGLSAYVWLAPVPLSNILRLLYGLISPLPIDTNPLNIFQGSGTIFWIVIMPFMFLNLWPAFLNPYKQILVIFWFVFFFGLTQTAFVPRQFVQFYPFALLLASDGYENHKKLAFPILAIEVFILPFFGGAYIAMKL